MTWLHFASNANFVTNRPYADVILEPMNAQSVTHKCLVDTGADYMQLPLRAAQTVGANLNLASNFPVNTASGAVSNFLLMHNMPVQIEGYLVHVDVLFDPSNSALPLAGRNLLLAAFDIGFETSQWHWGQGGIISVPQTPAL